MEFVVRQPFRSIREGATLVFEDGLRAVVLAVEPYPCERFRSRYRLVRLVYPDHVRSTSVFDLSGYWNVLVD